ncbi:T9SS C-terminal target domain-containing protein [Aquiflexum sp. TKW24L]|uniref:T9SS C-terminal target domain-containing protein n=1 Tax=Aquiflexum sp. TKW24L TaxID=2942212 RepID=UPI0020BDC38E|nr:T9SS C-terminal target domain-containing protein [Aquiflexum sp. TKW24L]MCL6258654.1 T9SS C-terminal target domain-containing protein [Aquiflexum sp. TKW24L]
MASAQVSIGQSCPGCTGTIKTYTRADSVEVNSGNNNFNRDSWSPINVPGVNDIARFSTAGNFTWRPNNATTIKGVVLEGNANLLLDRSNDGNNAVFIIQGSSAADKGCITVRSGSTLTLRYISNLNNVTICVEEGGRIVFDARDEDRNDYLFNGVDINLQGPGAQIEFGDADINLGLGGVTVTGYTGSGCILNQDGSYTLPSPVPNIIADPSTTNLAAFCNFLTAGGFSPLPVEWVYLNADFNNKERTGIIKWATAKEWENSHFEIERSVRGLDEFTVIGRVQGMGWKDSITEYTFFDKNLPLTGGNILYRLKQVDFNGIHSYSKVTSIKVANIPYTKGVWRAYPNPYAGEIFNLELIDEREYFGEDLRVRLISPSSNNKVITGTNLRLISGSILEELRKATKGIFVLEISWGQKVEFIKIMKQ